MKKNFVLFCLCAFSILSYAQSYDAKDLTIIGKSMSTPSDKHYYRVDIDRFSNMPSTVKNLFTNTSGLAVLFKTNSTKISAQWTVPSYSVPNNMTPIVHRGVDLYIKTPSGWQWAGVGRPSVTGTTSDFVLVENMDTSEKECMLYLPLYSGLTSLSIVVNSGSTFQTIPSPFTKRIAVYGSSITQGASAARPGLNYTSRLSRETGWEFLNLGLSGSGRMEPAVADMLATIDADAFILDCVPNSNTSDIANNTANLVETIRAAHPNAPIVFIHSVMRASGSFNLNVRNAVNLQNKMISDEVNKLLQKGIKKLYIITENDFLGTDFEGSTDGIHPNDMGFDRFLNKIRPQLLDILNKSFSNVTTFAGEGTRGFANGSSYIAKFASPRGIVFDSKGNIIVADNFNHRIRKVDSEGSVSTLAGVGIGGSANGAADASSFTNPYSVTVDNEDNVYVADFGSNKIRKITPDGIVSTLAGSGDADELDGSGTAAKFKGPVGITFDKTTNTLIVADYNGQTIRRVTLDGVVTTIAGKASTSGAVDGTGSDARFSAPALIAVDNAGNIILPDRGNDIIRKITPAGVVSTIAGKAKAREFADGTGEEARFNQPSAIVIDADGNYIVTDFGNNRIRMVTPTGVVTTFCENGTAQGSVNTSLHAQFNTPYGIALAKDGYMYVSEDLGNRICRLKLEKASSLKSQKVSGAPEIRVLSNNGGVDLEFVSLSGNGKLMIIQSSGAVVGEYDVDFDAQNRVSLQLPMGTYCAIAIQGNCKMATSFSVFR